MLLHPIKDLIVDPLYVRNCSRFSVSFSNFLTLKIFFSFTFSLNKFECYLITTKKNVVATFDRMQERSFCYLIFFPLNETFSDLGAYRTSINVHISVRNEDDVNTGNRNLNRVSWKGEKRNEKRNDCAALKPKRKCMPSPRHMRHLHAYWW